MGNPLDDFDFPESLRYRAFLSYRSTDRIQAQWLHRKLENYRVPSGLVGKTGEYGKIPPRIGRIFRDRAEARTAADIETVIADELAQSQHLVVLCTPRAAEDDSWVGREIQLFKARRPAENIHAVIGDGEPPGCFPGELIKTKPDGRAELPLAADLRLKKRGGQDGKQRALIKIIASLIGVKFDDLWKRDKRRRTLRTVTLLCLTAIITIGIVVTIGAAQTMRKIDQYMTVSSEAMDTYRWDMAALAAANAVRHGMWIGPLSSEQAELRLQNIRGTARTKAIMLGHAKGLTSVVLSKNEDVAFSASLDGRIFAWDNIQNPHIRVESDQLHKFIGRARHLRISRDGKRLFGYAGSRVAVMDAETRTLVTEVRLQAIIKSMGLARGEKEIVLGLLDGTVLLLSGDLFQNQQVLFEGEIPISSLAANEDGTHIVLGDVEGNVYAIDLVSPTISRRQLAKPEGGAVNHLVFDPSEKFIIASIEDSATIYEWSTGDVPNWFTLDEYQVFFSEVSPSLQYGLSLLSRDVLASWTFSDGELLNEFTVPGCENKDPFAYSCRVSTATFIPGTNTIPERILAGYYDGTIRIWSIQGEVLGTIPGHVARVSAFALSGDGKFFLSGSEDHSIRYWSISTDKRSLNPDLEMFCNETDPLLLVSSPLTLGEPLKFNSALDISRIDGTALNGLLAEINFESICSE